MVLTNTEEKVYQPLSKNMVRGEGLRKESEGQVRQSVLCIFQGKVAQNLEKVSIGPWGVGEVFCGESYPR